MEVLWSVELCGLNSICGVCKRSEDVAECTCMWKLWSGGAHAISDTVYRNFRDGTSTSLFYCVQF